MKTTPASLMRLLCAAPLLAVSAMQAQTVATKAAPALEAGTLLTKDDVAAVQGCKMLDATTSAGKNGSLRISQWFFDSTEPNMSVSLAVAQSDPGAEHKRSLKEFWHETFDRYADGKDEDEKEHADKKKADEGGNRRGRETEKDEGMKSPPQPVEGLGDVAYWTNNPVGGTLYVLKGEKFIRISVGGPDKPDVKLAKSKALAQKALARM